MIIIGGDVLVRFPAIDLKTSSQAIIRSIGGSKSLNVFNILCTWSTISKQQLGGSMFFNSCTFIENNIISYENGAGFVSFPCRVSEGQQGQRKRSKQCRKCEPPTNHDHCTEPNHLCTKQFIAQFSGVSNLVFNTLIENNVAVANHGMGTFFFIAGGVMVRDVDDIISLVVCLAHHPMHLSSPY
jgi:hypothetical protein